MVLGNNLDVVLSLLGLSPFYPDRLLRDEFCQISRPCAPDERPIANEYVPRYLIRRLFEVNPNALELSVAENRSDSAKGNQNDTPERTNIAKPLHPLDSLLAIFLSSDPIFRQDIAVRLFKCRLAVPIFFPKDNIATLFLWPLRAVTIKYYDSGAPNGGDCEKPANSGEQGFQAKNDQIREAFLPDALIPIVSFIRFKSQEISKSSLINRIMNNDANQKDVFFHRGSRGYTSQTYIIDGTIELGCFLSLGKINTSLICLNLRGNALEYSSARKFVLSSSEVVVVLCRMNETEQMETLLREVSSENGNILFVPTDSTPSEAEENHYTEFAMKHTADNINFLLNDAGTEIEFTDITRDVLANLLDQIKCAKSLAEKAYDLHKTKSVDVDECETNCTSSKESSLTMIKLLDRHPATERRNKAFPLQGFNWKELSRVQRELYTLSGKGESEDSSEYREQKLEQIDKCRRQQYKTIKETITDEMRLFIEAVQTDNSLQRRFFLRWLQLHLASLIREAGQPLLKRQEQCLLELKLSKGKDREKLTAKLDDINADLLMVSISVDHFIREMGQMFECVQNTTQRACPKQESLHDMCYSLPRVASNLILDGCSFEIMDGDVCCVALTWVVGVLESVSEKLRAVEEKDDVGIFAVSVVGNQSCGKSTLVNSMFGTDFTVSAGKATRGIHLQIMKVHNEYRQTSSSDYVIVLDTEGICSPDSTNIASHKRDNLLVTFVLGLSDMTLIALRGEHTGKIDQVLSVSMHAFLRMKLTSFLSSCKIVYLNVSPEDAQHLQQQEGVLVTNFDKGFDAACYLEQIPEGKLKFNDFVEFSSREDTLYIPPFLDGTNDLSTFSTDYIRHVQDLKHKILQKGETRVSGRTMNEISERIEQLWKAVISEDFALEFRSTLEAMARQKLDKKWSHAAWNLSNDALRCGLNACSAIKNCSEIDELAGVLKTELSQTEQNIVQAAKTTTDDLQAFFESDSCHSILQEWKHHTFTKLKELEAKLKGEQTQILEDCSKLQQRRIQIRKKDNVYKSKMITYIKQYVWRPTEQNNGIPADRMTELRTIFDSNWKSWVDNVAEEFRSDSKDIDGETVSKTEHSLTKSDIADDVKRVLKDEFLTQKVQIEMQWSISNPEKLEESNICCEAELNYEISEVPPKLLSKSDEPFEAYTHAKALTAVKEVIQHVSGVDSANKVEVPFDRLVRVLVKACNGLVNKLWAEHLEFVHAYDLTCILEKQKEHFFHIFRMMYDNENSLKHVANGFCTAIQTGVATAVKSKIPIALAHTIRTIINSFELASKEMFVLSIMLEMTQSEDCFCRAMEFIEDPNSCMRKVLTSYVKLAQKELSGHFIDSLVISHLADLRKILTTMIAESQNYRTLNMWLERFQQSSRKIIQLPDVSLLLSCDIGDIDFKELTTKILDQIQSDSTIISTMLLNDNTSMSTALYEAVSVLYDSICGCPARCPFCGAMCLYSQEDHEGEHFSTLHRPHVLLSATQDGPTSLAATCNDNVASNKSFRNNATNNELVAYKRYKTIDAYKNWDIPESGKQFESFFWKWFCSKYSDRIADMQKVESIQIPSSWKDISQDSVCKQLKKRIVERQVWEYIVNIRKMAFLHNIAEVFKQFVEHG